MSGYLVIFMLLFLGRTLTDDVTEEEDDKMFKIAMASKNSCNRTNLKLVFAFIFNNESSYCSRILQV